ncbi:hypothetical protein KIN20_027852 [Parelaphostrongylus tenuis]|uniref:Uncharacterized protein n=1 Tax=Parelaphostrongylus tenuis TaxID=148309 RepID=A0AAD5R032_PARTN|nr:hypothetical protein KIN20_027852 [Parelaphostrongylus tenuis]
MSKKKVHLEVPPVARPLHLNLNELEYTPPTRFTPTYLDHSPGLSQKIKIPKKRYSYADPLQRMDTPVFDKREISQVKKGPSSAATVLTMAGLFVVGILLIMSGTIVLLEHKEAPFVVTGCMFLGVGLGMLLVCALLQRKNIAKFVLDLDSDLYFLNMNQSYMWKVMFEQPQELPLSE